MLIKHNSFNRYIVECKLKTSLTIKNTEVSFNRYIVECKYIIYREINRRVNSFNRYIVECKFETGMKADNLASVF